MGTPAASVSKTLPARYYTDPERFHREIEKFYFESWICAGRTGEIGVGSFVAEVCSFQIAMACTSYLGAELQELDTAPAQRRPPYPATGVTCTHLSNRFKIDYRPARGNL